MEIDSFQVTIERDKDGYCIADVSALQGCHTQGSTCEESRKNPRSNLHMPRIAEIALAPSYLVLFHPAKEGGYWVEFPDFPGCITQGNTMDEAWAMAEDALAGYVEVMLEEGKSLPEPTLES